MRTISLHVSESDYAEFKSLAGAADRPVAELIREAMASWLEAQRRTGPSLLAVELVDCGAVLRPFDRAEVADEMFDR